MKNVISFCLWGNNPKYLVGALKNAALAPVVYPGWTARFFVHDGVCPDTINGLDKAGAEIMLFDNAPNWGSSLLRLLPISTPDTAYVIFRDCDSRLSTREKQAVDSWILNGSDFHIMRDHPYHAGFPILAGMFGCRGGVLDDIPSRIAPYLAGSSYHTDQSFIAEHLWPLALRSSLVHDEIFSKNPWPSPRNGLEYVGEPLDENDNACDANHRVALQNHIR